MENNNSFAEIAKRQDDIVLSVIGEKNINGFHKAYLMASAIDSLTLLLTPDYMAPIMKLQGTKLGFRTDKDKNGGYDMNVVRRCLIEAVFYGLQPCGNQFNIIAGIMYPTKEGLEYKANTMPGLWYSIVLGVPKVNQEKTSALFDNVRIKWALNGEEKREETIEIPLKIDAYASVDSMQGKAKRKSLAWMLAAITGESVTDGDVTDIPTVDSNVAEEIASQANKLELTMGTDPASESLQVSISEEGVKMEMKPAEVPKTETPPSGQSKAPF